MNERATNEHATIERTNERTNATTMQALWRHWLFGLYYVAAELFSSVSVGILFWQFANELVTVDEARRFYPLFAQVVEMTCCEPQRRLSVCVCVCGSSMACFFCRITS